VHLGLYGAWDFAGAIDVGPVLSESGEESLASMGAPRRTRLRMSEQEQESELENASVQHFPPDPIGQVRVRLLTEDTVADLRGPTACEVLDAGQVQAVIDGLGPDPMVDRGKKAEQRFVDNVRRRAVPIGILLMDQSVVAGIGNVYRAELLYRARLNPHTPGKQLTDEQARALWRDWVKLMKIGVQTGQMFTTDRVRRKVYWVYHRTGEPCRTCGTPIVTEVMQTRNLYWCTYCQR
jgi:formamidopyrimidine-DNA glycosylase